MLMTLVEDETLMGPGKASVRRWAPGLGHGELDAGGVEPGPKEKESSSEMKSSRS